MIGNLPVENGLNKEKILEDLLESSNIKRYHTFPILGEQTVGTHTHRVMIILHWLGANANTMFAALYHDSAELATGDMPATTKWENPLLAEQMTVVEMNWEEEHQVVIPLDTEEYRLLKTADMMELVMFAREQMMLGNKNAQRLLHRGILYVRGLYPDKMPVPVQRLINLASTPPYIER